MSSAEEVTESPGNTLCKSCGLCCTGHLFIWTKLKSAELDSAAALGLRVLRDVPRQRGFNQPCSLWRGQCTVYSSPQYPHFCRTYKCKLLKKLLDETVLLPDALANIAGAKELIEDVETLLPPSPLANFRERLVEQLETQEKKSDWDENDLAFRLKVDALLDLYKQVFGVDDLIENPWDSLNDRRQI